MADALDALTHGEMLYDYKPAGKSEPTTATKTMLLLKLPHIMVLHLMRFDFGSAGSAKVRRRQCCRRRLAARGAPRVAACAPRPQPQSPA